MIKMAKQYLQPHPGLRIEEVVYEKLDIDRRNKIQKTPIGAFGNSLINTGEKMEPESLFGQALIQTGKVERELAQEWIDFETKTARKFIDPMQIFIDTEIKEATKMKTALEKARLNMDSSSTKYKKAVRSLSYSADTEYKIKKEEKKMQEAQIKYKGLLLMSQAKYKSLVEDTKLNDLLGLVTIQREYYKRCYEKLDALFLSISQSMAEKKQQNMTGNLTGIQAIAISDYTSQNEDELNLKIGQKVVVTDQEPGIDRYWEIYSCGQIGLVPAHCLDFERAITNRDWTASIPDELSFRAGEVMTIINRDIGRDGMVQCFLNGQVGLCHLSHLRFEDNNPFSTSNYSASLQSLESREYLMRSGSISEIGSHMSLLNDKLSQSTILPIQVELGPSIAAVSAALSMLSNQMMQLTKGNQIPFIEDVAPDAIFSIAEPLASATKAMSFSDPANLLDNLAMASQKVIDLDSALQSLAGNYDLSIQQKLISCGHNITACMAEILNAVSSQDVASLKEGKKKVAMAISNLIDNIVELKSPKKTMMPSIQNPFQVMDAEIDESKIALQLYLNSGLFIPQNQSKTDCLKLIIDTTKALLEHAATRQSELGMPSVNQYAQNDMWKEGLISAAKATCSSVVDLLSSVEHDDSSESIVAKALLVKSTIAQLISASGVKEHSISHDKLALTGTDLVFQIEDLVKCFKKSRSISNPSISDDKLGYASSKALQVDQQARILALEKELEEERMKLSHLRKKEYDPAI